MSMTSREQFEQAIKARFGDSIDYRVCKNSDGEYMAWDMQVAWWAWQAASKASEQQLAAVVAENDRAVKAVTVFSNVTHDITEIICDELGQEHVAEIVAAYNDLGNMPATDAYLAEVRASEAKHVYDSILDNPAVTDMGSLVDWLEQHAKDSTSFAAQLRQGEKS
ncbi:hypothetical protein AB9B48_14965 [Kluyvera ascorbata]|uniref:hypothetical protein n=1 Tax=Kluyvera ascorbata TaxID=51288 RepID=UPI0035102E0D